MTKERAAGKGNTTKVQGITIRRLGPTRYAVDLRGVSKNGAAWKSFKTLDEAKAYAEQLHVERVNRGVEGFRLTDAQRRDALDALAVLGDGVTLTEAAREYRRRYPAEDAESLQDTSDRLMAWMEKEGRRPISIREARRRIRLFIEDHPDRATQSIDRRDVLEWTEARGWEGVTAKNYRNAVLTLLNFHAGNMRRRVMRQDKPVTIWDVETVRHMMATAADSTPAIVPAFAVLFFAGLRPHEMMRLNWNQIDLESGHIRLEGEQVKTGSARIVDLSDNARTWLVRYRSTGGIIPSASWYRKRREEVMRAAGVEQWPKDVSRHSFASYLYALTGDAPKVAAQLGHWQGLDVLNRHYRAVATAADARRYFNITPHAAGGRVLAL